MEGKMVKDLDDCPFIYKFHLLDKNAKEHFESIIGKLPTELKVIDARDRMFEMLDMDLSPVFEGLSEKDTEVFKIAFSYWTNSCKDFTEAVICTMLIKDLIIPLGQKKNTLQKAVELLGNGIMLAPDEAREMFRIMKNIADDAHYARHPRTEWPLYDKLAAALGENSLAEHNEALQLRDGEEMVDEWQERCRELEREREERDE